MLCVNVEQCKFILFHIKNVSVKINIFIWFYMDM
jgi:hypothetical protein